MQITKIICFVFIISSFALLKASPLDQIHTTKDGEHFITTSTDKQAIYKVAFKNGVVVDTLFYSKTARSCPFEQIDGFSISDDEQRILISTDIEPTRTGRLEAEYYTFEIRRNLVKRLSENGKQQAAIFSPNGRMVTFARNGNLYLKKLDYDTESVVIENKKEELISNGIPSFAYLKAFDSDKSFVFSSDNNFISFIQYNSNQTQPYFIQDYPSATNTNIYPTVFSYDYPMAGFNISRSGLFVYSVETRGVKKILLPMQENDYLPYIIPTANDEVLGVVILNKAQNRLALYALNIKTGISRLLVEERSDHWINPSLAQDIHFYETFFIMPSYRNGYRQICQYALNGSLIKQITNGAYNITSYLGYDDRKKQFFFQAAMPSAQYRTVLAVDSKGKTQPINTPKGYNQILFSGNYNYGILQHNNIQTDNQYSIRTSIGKEIKSLNGVYGFPRLENKKSYTSSFFQFKNKEGEFLNGVLINSTSERKQNKPLIIIPPSKIDAQQALDQWGKHAYEYLINNGYTLVCIDVKGSLGYNSRVQRFIYKNTAMAQSTDIFSAIQYLRKNPEINAEKLVLLAENAGTLAALKCAQENLTLFKGVIVINPLTDWRYALAPIAERYMSTPKENEEGYTNNSALNNNASQFPLLIIANQPNRTIHAQNTMGLINSLVNNEKVFNMQLYPTCSKDQKTKKHQEKTILDFIEKIGF